MHISVQAIDDEKGVTLFSASDMKIAKGTKSERAQEVGKSIAQQLVAGGVTACIFDR
jgi:large subunit ribosomal protein L18